MTEDIFDVCDAEDRVLRQERRSVVHARGLLHRAVHIFVFNPAGELLVQLRSATKDQSPLCYTSSASGHVDAGEEYDVAAVRELQEELSLDSPLERLRKFPACDELAREHTVLYRTVTDQRPDPDPEEIAEIRFLPLAGVRDLMDRQPELITSPFRVLFEWYCEEHGRDGHPLQSDL